MRIYLNKEEITLLVAILDTLEPLPPNYLALGAKIAPALYLERLRVITGVRRDGKYYAPTISDQLGLGLDTTTQATISESEIERRRATANELSDDDLLAMIGVTPDNTEAKQDSYSDL